MYKFLYVDLNPNVFAISALNYQSFQYGLSLLPLDPSLYNLTYETAGNNTILTTQQIVQNYLQTQPDIGLTIEQRRFIIITGTSNQLTGTENALRLEGGTDYVQNTLVIAISALSSLPSSRVLSLLYSSEKETKATVIHQSIQDIRTVLLVYEKDNVYCEDYVTLYQQKSLAKEVTLVPLTLGSEQKTVEEINQYLDQQSRKTLRHLEILMVTFTPQSNLIIPQIKYKKGIRVLCCLASDGLNPKGVSKCFPIMLCKAATLDITLTTREYYEYMLTYLPVRPSAFAPAFFDIAIQLGQMVLLAQPLTITTFCQRLTVYFPAETAFLGAGWLDPVAQRSIFASYYFMYTYDPVMGKPFQLEEYEKRSPWMPVLPTSAGVPYQISFVFWVQPSNWIVYYNDWRLLENIQQPYDFLKLYLGLDTGIDTRDISGKKFTVTGYVSYLLGIYFREEATGKQVPFFEIPQDKQPIFEYPFQVVHPVRFSLS